MKKSVKWVAATAAVMLTLSASVGVTSSADEGTTVKAGFIFLHDENSTYDLNFINAAKEACEEMGIEYVFKTGIRKHMTLPASWQMPAATSYLQTASAMRITSLRPQESSRTYSSVTQPEPKHIRKDLTTSTMLSLLFMRDVTWLVSPLV